MLEKSARSVRGGYLVLGGSPKWQLDFDSGTTGLISDFRSNRCESAWLDCAGVFSAVLVSCSHLTLDGAGWEDSRPLTLVLH